jgi:hypothetical protein
MMHLQDDVVDTVHSLQHQQQHSDGRVRGPQHVVLSLVTAAGMQQQQMWASRGLMMHLQDHSLQQQQQKHSEAVELSCTG